eukprot:COSAG02_NODE_725_length_18021_cov_392.218279_4_plen_167_part_00
MAPPHSPVFDDPGELRPGERWSSDSVLGEGHHATAELKLAFLQLWRMFQNKELILRPRDKKRVPEGNVAKVAMALGISHKPVQAAVNEHNAYNRVIDPDPRGPAPTDWDDYAPTEGFALVRKAIEVLQRKGWPNSAPKIVDEIKAFKHKDCDGNLVELFQQGTVEQ